MELQPGQSLLHYRLVEKIGEGGMGQVFVADDDKLGRKVALKILPPVMAGDPERRARFEREARAVAALNHPNIVTVYAVEEVDGQPLIAMELVEGRNLTSMIPEQGVPLDRLLPLASTLADALAAAHQQGILHRDLKPDNIMITGEGRLKILDFGLAKLTDPPAADGTTSGSGSRPGALPADFTTAGTQLPTATVTGDGRIVGTVAYMSPEQAEGKPVDARTDLFSLGVILYELATGKRPFAGETAMSTLSAVLRDDPPPVTELSPALPRELARIVRRCLAKDPARRFQTALDIRNELDELKSDVDAGITDGDATTAGVEAAIAAPAPSARSWKIATGVLALALVGAIAAVGILSPGSEGTDAPAGDPAATGGLVPTMALGVTGLTDRGDARFPSLSPDGRMALFVSGEGARSDIYLQRVGGANAINLTEDFAGDDTHPAYSPDGERIAFRSDRQGGGIFVMGATGENPTRVADTGWHPAWSPDGGRLYYCTESILNPYQRLTVSQIWEVDLGSRERRLVFDGDAAEPKVSPDGSRIAYWAVTGGQRDLFTIPSAGGEPVAVTDDGHTDWAPIWSVDGEALYFISDRGGSPDVWRVAIDPATGEVTGEPSPVTAGISAVRRATLSADGGQLLASVLRNSTELLAIPWQRATGRITGEPDIVFESGRVFMQFAPSPDGTRIAYTSTQPEEDVFVMNADGSGRRQLTTDPDRDRWVIWKPDGSELTFMSNRTGDYEFWAIRPDGSGLRSLTPGLGFSLSTPVWSPDGRRFAGTRIPAGGDEAGVMMIFDVQSDGSPERSATVEAFSPFEWSPDGKQMLGGVGSGTEIRLAVHDLETGDTRSLDIAGDRRLVSYGAIWLDDGRFLFNEPGTGLFQIYDPTSGALETAIELDGGNVPLGGFFANDDTLLVQNVAERTDIWMIDLGS